MVCQSRHSNTLGFCRPPISPPSHLSIHEYGHTCVMYTPPLSQTYCKMYVSLLFRRYPDVPDFVWVAFKAARAAAPKGVKLFYNDYSINNFDRAKSTRVYAIRHTSYVIQCIV